MHFRTQIPISKSLNPLDYNSKVMSFGSCFVVNIGEKFDYFKFQISTNPFGIIFNPVSIQKIIRRVVEKNFFTEEDVFFANGRWHCFEVHSELSSVNKESFILKLNQLIEQTNTEIKEATHILITYGTSWVYREKEQHEVVANCHKLPQKKFDKELLTVEINRQAVQDTMDAIRELNPNANLVFTVSPVRHIKDGFVENQISKAHLIAAIHSTLTAESRLHNYFPSYEIMMDELRDYRFYAEDMLHPNQTAIDYIWKLFAEANITPDAFATMKEIDGIQKSLRHKPFNKEDEAHAKFLSQLQENIKRVQARFAHIHF